ncbi:MAG: peptidoglycan-binding protein [Bacteroidales bacterium]|jgi:peptidoglycan hydrolase-like protein with peptidoglycan-binding domain|nr:peptidoglycan-binding protein [Bacteroidales bacterium]
MTKTTKIIIGIVAVAAIIAAIIIITGKKSNAQETPIVGGGTNPNPNKSVFPLRTGVMNNNDVATLQAHLNSKGANLDVDGDFGSLTEAALMKQYGKKELSAEDFKAIINS